LNEERARRRYGLTPRFSAARRKMYSGFAPVQAAKDEGQPPHETDDAFEENARLVGSRAFVSRPVRGVGRVR
jgi:hypothetical protein